MNQTQQILGVQHPSFSVSMGVRGVGMEGEGRRRNFLSLSQMKRKLSFGECRPSMADDLGTVLTKWSQ